MDEILKALMWNNTPLIRIETSQADTALIASIQDNGLSYASMPFAWFSGEASKPHNLRRTNCGRKLGSVQPSSPEHDIYLLL